MGNDPLFQKVMADYGQYMKPAQGYAEGGNVPSHTSNLTAWEEALKNKPAITKEKYSYKGYPLTYKGNGIWEEDVPDITTKVLVPAYSTGAMGGMGGFGGGSSGLFTASGQPYNQGANFSLFGQPKEQAYRYESKTEPGYLLQYQYDPRLYQWDEYGRNIGKKPQLFGGALSGLSGLSGLGSNSGDTFNVGSAVRGLAKGGYVKGYAEGGEYDPMNPDFAGQVRENMNQNLLYNMREPQVVNVPVTAAPVASSAVQEALAQRRAILADLNKALTAPSSSGMTEAEKNWRLAAAFGKTGKTGHFAESLASVGDTMADIQAEKRKEAAQQAALGLQRLQARSELAGQQYTLAREAEMQDLLKKYLTKGQQVTGDVAAGATQPAGGGMADGIPEDVKALILAQPTEKAVSTIIDMAKENNKPSDLVKGINFLVANGAITREEGAQIVKENLQGKLEQVDVNVPELGGTFKLTGPEAREYYSKGVLPTRLGGKPKATPAGTVETAPSGEIKPAAKPISQEQAKATETALVEQAKTDIEEGKNLVGQKQFATDQINASKRVLGLAKTNPKAFGITADPGIFNAVTALVETGVTTPWGSFSINVEEPLSKLKLKPEELQGRRQAIQALTQIEIGYRKLFLKGEGAVSNMEGQLAARLGPEIKDDPKTVQIKAGIIQIAAEKQNSIIDGYQKYKAKNPAAGPQAYYQTPEYKRIVDSYENKYAAFAKKAGIPIDESLSATPTATKGGGNLVDTLKNDPRWNQ